jgi:hypothetical protein
LSERLLCQGFSSWKRYGNCDRKEARTSFLKKRSKKLLSVLASASQGKITPESKKLSGSFLQKRTACHANYFGHGSSVPARVSAMVAGLACGTIGCVLS